MRTTIDMAGRVVIPKSLREAVGLQAGQEIEVTERDGRIEIETAPTPMRAARRGTRVVAEPERDLPPLTTDQVRDVLERVRR